MNRDEWAAAMEREAASVSDEQWQRETRRVARWRVEYALFGFFALMGVLHRFSPAGGAETALGLGCGMGAGIMSLSPRNLALASLGYPLASCLASGLLFLLGVGPALPLLGIWTALAFVGLAWAGCGLGRLLGGTLRRKA